MKYLKKFESIDNFGKELQEFCDNHLAYLKDDGFIINCFYRYEDVYGIIIIKDNNGRKEWFNLSELENDLIQFLTYLKLNYTTNKRICFNDGTYDYPYDIDDLINYTGDYLKDRKLLDDVKINHVILYKIIDSK